MQKKIASILFSTRLTALLFIVFAVSMAVGTFMDASSETSPTPYSREIIYNAWWFEAIMVLFVVNFVGNIFRFRLYKKEKWATLMLHLSFILILVGAFVTRYIGYEGALSIREGATENVMMSEHAYLNVFVDGDYMVDGVAMRRNLAPRKMRLSERLNNDFTINTDYNQKPITIAYRDFYTNAKQGLVEDENGDQYLKIVEAGDGNRHDHWLKSGEIENIHNVLFALNKPTEGAINIIYDAAEDTYDIATPFEGSAMRMADQKQFQVTKDSVQPLLLRSLYQVAGMAFVIPEPITNGTQGLIKADVSEKTNQNALLIDITANGETKTLELLGGKGSMPDPKNVEIDGMKIYASYGSEPIELPFSITLNDFIAEKYPGTERGYKSYKSKITVVDGEELTDEEIYMNHVLDKDGYRFFQSGFDPDEKGTILAVNHDFWGTWITYIGYFLLYFGLMAILFDRNTRFANLKAMLEKIKKKKSKLSLLILLLLSFGTSAQSPLDTDLEDGVNAQQEHIGHTSAASSKVDSLIIANAVSKEHAAEFGKLVIQDDGRMKPVNTYASELLRKISRRNSFNGLDPNQVFISMTEFPRFWVETPLIAIKWQNDSLRDILGVDKDASRIALLDLFDERGNNKLEPYLEAATSTNTPTQIQKDITKTYENAYLLNQALTGGILKIFPIPNDENNRWVSYPELNEANFTGMDSTVTRTILPVYFQSVNLARKDGDYEQAEDILQGIRKFQNTYGSEVMPSENKVKAEIIYNRVDIFNRLYKYFAMIGVLMFVVLIIQIFKEGKVVKSLVKICKYIIWVFFILMTLGLIMRWYVSGHAPWSDAYESIIYVAWATVFFGLAFGRKSDLTIASTAFVAAIILWVANQNWLDPSIANLQPVLDSYWLMIHVAVIVASYGPFTLGMILGATSLLLMILTTDTNRPKMDLNIKELTIITEMALTVGLVMLTIGNFLGGQWANESWGRYWGWDPKETWALISIMVYAFVLHMRLIPGLRGRWFFNVMAIFSFASIMMTYFGVNFYLTGLHSYASGDTPVTPWFVFILTAFFLLLSVIAYFRYRKFYMK